MSSTDKKVFSMFALVSLVIALPIAGVIFGMIFAGLFLTTGFLVFAAKTVETGSRKSFWERLKKAFTCNDKIFRKVHSTHIRICEFVIGLFEEKPKASPQTETAPKGQPVFRKEDWKDEEDGYW